MAFQVTDDLLDFTSSDDALGKGVGVDLLGGKVTLPLIDLMAYDPSYRDKIQAVMRDGAYGDVTRQELRDALEASGSLTRARARADAFAGAATQNVEELPDSKYAESLKSLPTYVIERDR